MAKNSGDIIVNASDRASSILKKIQDSIKKLDVREASRVDKKLISIR